MRNNDTIAAISTPLGTGGIAVIRISGAKAFSVADRIFKSPAGKRLFEVASHSVLYGNILDGDELVDEVMLTILKSPKTFTGEDTVEISCHGGILITKKVLKTCIKAGARLADRGEFSKRAFLNGKIDLAQAEGIIDLINSSSEASLSNATSQIEGNLSKKILNSREILLNLAAHMEAAADFPEEDVEELEIHNLKGILDSTLDTIESLIKTADYGKILRAGIKVAVIGKPNVGKSSFLNLLAGEERAIVTDIAGTTRDVIEEYINIAGIPVRLMDTAGIRESKDLVESIGVEKSKKTAKEAQLVVAILDGSKPLSDEDKEILDLISNKDYIIVINKVDLANVVKIENAVNLSAKTGQGLNDFYQAITNKLGNVSIDSEEIITNERHLECLVNCQSALKNAISAIDSSIPMDMISIDVKDAIESLGMIVGLTVSEEIVERVFKNFCVGK